MRKSKAVRRALRKLVKARDARVKCNLTRKQLVTHRSAIRDSTSRLGERSPRANITGMGHLRSHRTGNVNHTCKRFAVK